MFDNIETGTTVLIRFEGSTQGLAMRVQYDGNFDGMHHMSGLGVMADARIVATEGRDGWTLTTGRRLFAVEAV
jgi:hypothetical protein